MTDWGPETADLVTMLEDAGLRLVLRDGKLEVSGPAEAKQRLAPLIRERRYDLQAWLRGDRARGVRRVDGEGTVRWQGKYSTGRVALANATRP